MFWLKIETLDESNNGWNFIILNCSWSSIDKFSGAIGSSVSSGMFGGDSMLGLSRSLTEILGM